MVCYAVVRFGAEWGVLSERKRIGRFSAKDSALQLGVMLAFEALAAGHEVELLVQDLGGQLAAHPLPNRRQSPMTPMDMAAQEGLAGAPAAP